MKLIKSAISTVLGSLFAASSSMAVTQLDQNQSVSDPNPDFNFFTFSSTLYGAQSFQQAHGNIVGAGIFLTGSANASDTVTISLYSGLPLDNLGNLDLSANLLASASGTGSGGAWFDVFWPQLAITPNATYYLVFSSLDPQNNGLGIGAMDTVNDYYTDGNAFTTDQFIAWDWIGPSSQGGDEQGYDFAFRTFYDDGTRTPTHNAPDGGSTLAILGLSFTLLGIVRSKR